MTKKSCVSSIQGPKRMFGTKHISAVLKRRLGKQSSCRQQISICLHMGGKTSLSVIGSFKAVLTAGDRTINTEIYVTSEPSAYPLLSKVSKTASTGPV